MEIYISCDNTETAVECHKPSPTPFFSSRRMFVSSRIWYFVINKVVWNSDSPGVKEKTEDHVGGYPGDSGPSKSDDRIEPLPFRLDPDASLNRTWAKQGTFRIGHVACVYFTSPKTRHWQ